MLQLQWPNDPLAQSLGQGNERLSAPDVWAHALGTSSSSFLTWPK